MLSSIRNSLAIENTVLVLELCKTDDSLRFQWIKLCTKIALWHQKSVSRRGFWTIWALDRVKTKMRVVTMMYTVKWVYQTGTSTLVPRPKLSIASSDREFYISSTDWKSYLASYAFLCSSQARFCKWMFQVAICLCSVNCSSTFKAGA